LKTHQLLQGSPEWKAWRREHYPASDAPAMMGCSPYKTRAQLLRERHTGVEADVDAGQQKRFDNGHRLEGLARPGAEQIVGEDLYPVSGSLGRLSASFDGLTMEEREGFEHKQLSAAIKAAFDAMAASGLDEVERCRLLPVYHRVQMEQQLHVAGAERILFMASDWTADGELIEERHCWYYPDAELRADILRGWDQFAADLAAYVLPESVEPAPVGKAPESLPALRIEVTGEVTASNLAEFKQTALAAIRSVNRDLRTDADFADAEKAVKWCADVESRIAAAKQHALSQTASIDALFKTLEDISSEAKAVRLDLGKLVTRRKEDIKLSAVEAARRALDKHIADLNGELAPMRLQPVAADFAGAIKGLRSISSMQDALDSTLAAGKIAADSQARMIRGNVATFKAAAEGLEFLFADLGAIVHKAADDFSTLVQARIATHRAAEAERERKRKADEEARIAAEAKRLADEAIRQAEAKRQAEELAAQIAESAKAEALAAEGRFRLSAQTTSITPVPDSQQVLKAEAARPDATDREQPAIVSPRGGAVGVGQAAAAAPIAEPATLKLGVICERLGVTMTAQFLADVLHVRPARVDGASRLFTESQYLTICRQLQAHVGAMAEMYAGVEA